MTTARRPIWALGDVVRQQTVVYRKGEVVKEHEVGKAVRVISIDAFPEAPYHGVLVDVFFVEVGFTEAAVPEIGSGKGQFVEALKAAIADGGEFLNLTAEDLAKGPSYITYGGWLGDQTLALQFMALVKFYEMGEVILPSTIGITDEKEAARLAGQGFVMGVCRLP